MQLQSIRVHCGLPAWSFDQKDWAIFQLLSRMKPLGSGTPLVCSHPPFSR